MQLCDFDIDLFLNEYWQKKPMFIKNPWKNWNNPLEPDELAGLSCEENIESRLILKGSSDKNPTWKLEHGPFAEERFENLDHGPWTILVQAVNHYIPQVNALLEPFRFIPNWRIDDVMASYANDRGGVGPHYDQYDVFLVQGLGTRKWQVGQKCDSTNTMLPHEDLHLLADFQIKDEWICEPGDIVYIPPLYAHNGIATGDDCMTYSIGFRAPSKGELIAHYCDHIINTLSEDDRYTDPHRNIQKNTGEIESVDLDALYTMVNEVMLDREDFTKWFGRYNSQPKYPDIEYGPNEIRSLEEIRNILQTGHIIERNPISRFSFIQSDQDTVTLFVDGHIYHCDSSAKEFAMQLCNTEALALTAQHINNEAITNIIMELYQNNALTLDL